MNDLNGLVSFLTETLKQGLSFAQDKVPAYVEQVLEYGFFRNMIELSVWAVLFVVATIVFLYFLKNLLNTKKKWLKEKHPRDFDISYDWDYELWWLFASAGASMLFMFCAITTVTQLVKIKVAPIVYLIERTAELL